MKLKYALVRYSDVIRFKRTRISTNLNNSIIEVGAVYIRGSFAVVIDKNTHDQYNTTIQAAKAAGWL